MHQTSLRNAGGIGVSDEIYNLLFPMLSLISPTDRES